MILYFSGTGNSKYVAEKIAEVTGDTLFSMNDAIKAGNHERVNAEGNLIFSVPTYAWRIPRLVEDWIRKTEFDSAGKVWFLMTCGDQIGNAEKYIKLLCTEKRFEYMGVMQIIMPENYIAMFNAPEEEEAEQIIKKADPDICRAGALISECQPFPAARNNLYDRFMSKFVNPLFYKSSIKDEAFAAGDACTGCGQCESLCPLNNISLKYGKPVWKGNCTHCMACICHCPTEAIEYGTKSAGKPRYHID